LLKKGVYYTHDSKSGLKCHKVVKLRKEMGDMFMGTFSHSLDAKGRLIVPSKLREGLGENFIITKNLDHCLGIYPESEWQKFTASLETLPKISSEVARRLRRFYFGNSITLESDKQGRVLIPNDLREYAGLTKDITLVGVDDHIEVWDTDAWTAYNESLDLNELTDDLSDLNL